MRWFALLLLLTACCRPLDHAVEPCVPNYYLTVFIASKQLKYGDFYQLCRSLQKESSGHVGHAWVHLHGLVNGHIIDIVGGHSGELGQICPTYCEGVMDLVDAGDPNPVKYLWSQLGDGFFQQGSGGHKPTFEATLVLTREQFEAIHEFMLNYDYHHYALTGWQCASFVSHALALAGCPLDCTVKVQIRQYMTFNGRKMCLWKDPKYSEIVFSSPDLLEKRLRNRRATKGHQRL